MGEMTVGGHCGYAGFKEDGIVECQNMGLRIRVTNEFGDYMSIVRCIEHSDWIQAGEIAPAPSSARREG